jgi:molybdopterin-containing oxidoreductase family membrane subunit
MARDNAVMGIFDGEGAALSALDALARTPWKPKSVHSPIPSHRIAQALKVGTSRVGWFTLAGGIIGFFLGFALAAFTASRWHLIVSGKPVMSWIPFFIVGFEFTILFAVFGNVAGLIHQMGLPDFKGIDRYDPRCSGEHYGILVECTDEETGAVQEFFRQQGAEIRPFDDRHDRS